jgi:hypothetical protein
MLCKYGDEKEGKINTVNERKKKLNFVILPVIKM